MEPENLFMVCFTVVAIVIAGVALHYCETQNDRIGECIKAGKDPDACERAFTEGKGR